MTIRSTFLAVLCTVFIGAIGTDIVAHYEFMSRSAGVLTRQGAADVGLISKAEAEDPFTPRFVFAPAAAGGYEYRAQYPLVGLVPYGFFKNDEGTTRVDLVAKCKSLGTECRLRA